MQELFTTFINWYMEHINYLTITLLMAIESSFIPFPSEVVIPPAAWKAAQGNLNIFGVFACGTAGALIGAIFNYYFALYLGRKVLYSLADTRLAHLLLINRESLVKAENYFNKYGRSSTFIGRLLPAIRQLIPLPAGVARMDIKAFLLFTTLGAGIWNLILVLLGFFLYSQKELLERYYHLLSYTFLGVGAVFVAYVVIKTILTKKTTREKQTPVTEISHTGADETAEAAEE